MSAEGPPQWSSASVIECRRNCAHPWDATPWKISHFVHFGQQLPSLLERKVNLSMFGEMSFEIPRWQGALHERIRRLNQFLARDSQIIVV
jgi:hypothetical protein